MEKFKEICIFLLSIIFILVAARYTGFLDGFTPADFEKAFNSLLKNSSKVTSKTPIVTNKRISTYGNYQPSSIPGSVIRGAESVRSNIFNSDVKVILYIYDDTNSDKEFHYYVQNYISKSPAKTKYNMHAYTKSQFKGLRLGEGAPSKICDSLQECREQRQKAADYASFADFIENCGRSMCIINPSKVQYVALKKRVNQDAVKMIGAMKNW